MSSDEIESTSSRCPSYLLGDRFLPDLSQRNPLVRSAALHVAVEPEDDGSRTVYFAVNRDHRRKEPGNKDPLLRLGDVFTASGLETLQEDLSAPLSFSVDSRGRIKYRSLSRTVATLMTLKIQSLYDPHESPRCSVVMWELDELLNAIHVSPDVPRRWPSSTRTRSGLSDKFTFADVIKTHEEALSSPKTGNRRDVRIHQWTVDESGFIVDRMSSGKKRLKSNELPGSSSKRRRSRERPENDENTGSFTVIDQAAAHGTRPSSDQRLVADLSHSSPLRRATVLHVALGAAESPRPTEPDSVLYVAVTQDRTSRKSSTNPKSDLVKLLCDHFSTDCDTVQKDLSDVLRLYSRELCSRQQTIPGLMATFMDLKIRSLSEEPLIARTSYRWWDVKDLLWTVNDRNQTVRKDPKRVEPSRRKWTDFAAYMASVRNELAKAQAERSDDTSKSVSIYSWGEGANGRSPRTAPSAEQGRISGATAGSAGYSGNRDAAAAPGSSSEAGDEEIVWEDWVIDA